MLNKYALFYGMTMDDVKNAKNWNFIFVGIIEVYMLLKYLIALSLVLVSEIHAFIQTSRQYISIKNRDLWPDFQWIRWQEKIMSFSLVRVGHFTDLTDRTKWATINMFSLPTLKKFILIHPKDRQGLMMIPRGRFRARYQQKKWRASSYMWPQMH